MKTSRVPDGVYTTFFLTQGDVDLLEIESRENELSRSAVVRLMIRKALGPKQKALQN